MITPSAIQKAVLKLRNKKFSDGADSICADHFIAPIDLLYNYLALLFQMVFNVGVVLAFLHIGVIRAILKKNKPKSSCSSYMPVNLSSVFTKIFKLLIVDHLRENCIVPLFQIGFQSGLGCFHALRSLCNRLRHTEAFGRTLVLGAYDVMNAFDSPIH